MIRTNKKTLRKIIREEYLKILVENERESLMEHRAHRWEDVQLAKIQGLDTADLEYFEDIGQDPYVKDVPEEDKPWLYGVEDSMEDPLMRGEEDIDDELWGHLDPEDREFMDLLQRKHSDKEKQQSFDKRDSFSKSLYRS
jgi:hypothetical protein